ncbi:ribonuclease R [Furfurilactobacillus rossiae]|uniref:Ribonuclease R n=1 Tax=Furfurilactobacillus rossiae DSM 15814 TaxID=1114972 RepID=A0A0R1RIB4_9LACO|nr:ribonuclease R [Furfurilactobacillus rossiae]KRL56591.1 ribonuclease R [Furfurilactobacillus rossiae DSM 15814]QFR66505.1 ribonuclease R [Furfurilactobacillus rossiae]QLE61970.1 3'-to-5' exoribonuclease RNase R [Furfurilactobacillus rossiae]
MTESNLQQQILTFLNANQEGSFTAAEIGTALKQSEAEFTLSVQALAGLERAGKVAVTDTGKWAIVKVAAGLSGTFHGNDKGFGFVAYDDEQPDAYINPDHTKHAMTGDTVEMKILRPSKPGSDRGPEGEVTKVTERHYTQIVGEFRSKRDAKLPSVIGEVLLKDKKLGSYTFDVLDGGIHPVDGEVVTADVTGYPTDLDPQLLSGVATKVIGNADEPGIDILQIVYAHDVPSEFPQEVLDEANAIPDTVQEADKDGRVDITDQPLVTIDSIESKDLDDAVVAWKLPNGNYHLGVSIADVSYYVKEGSALDKEAYKRGTSVYLTDRVIPMLPKRLSNGICSLNEGVERLSMTCDMEIDGTGKVVSHKIYPSLMKSHARMTYKGVNKILEAHDAKTMERYDSLVGMFETMAELHKILVKKRHQRGAIDFDAPEAKIIVDAEGHPTDIELRERGLAERMIESFMLAANETVAEHYDRMHVPFLYRVHETPDGDRVKSFFDLLNVFGINAKGDPNNLKPKMLQSVLKEVAGTPEEQMVQTMMLRSMKQAKYSDQPLGHFGLGAEYYTHFTSPIRRYPDDMVHRMIRWYAANGDSDAAKAKYADKLPQIAQDTSERERRSIDTERATDDMKKAEYMADHVGEDFDAVVSSVLKFGMFVELPNTVEGLIHISNMKDDFYDYDESHLALIGERHHHIFQIGQPIRVHLEKVDKDAAAVDFTIVDPRTAPTTDIRVAHDNHGNGGRRGNGNRGNRNFHNNAKRDEKNGGKKFNHYQSNRNKAGRSGKTNFHGDRKK